MCPRDVVAVPGLELSAHDRIEQGELDSGYGQCHGAIGDAVQPATPDQGVACSVLRVNSAHRSSSNAMTSCIQPKPGERRRGG